MILPGETEAGTAGTQPCRGSSNRSVIVFMSELFSASDAGTHRAIESVTSVRCGEQSRASEK
jgi:hypothetical protein